MVVCACVPLEIPVTNFLQKRRGFDAALLVVDEMAFLKALIFIDLILPLMMQDKTGIVGLTTPKGEKNQFFLHLLRAKDKDGNSIFLKLQSKEYCDACAALNKADTCPHEVYGRSTNKTAKSMEKARLVYGDEYATAGNEELLGMDTSGKGSVIPIKDIEAFQSNVVTMEKPPRVVYVTMDPGGGGRGSEMGIIIAVETTGTYGQKITVSNILFFTLSSSWRVVVSLHRVFGWWTCVWWVCGLVSPLLYKHSSVRWTGGLCASAKCFGWSRRK